MPAWTVKSHGKEAINTVLKVLQGARKDFVVSPYAKPTIDPANGVVWASFVIPGMQNPQASLYIEEFGDSVSMRLEGINPNVVSDTRKTAKRAGEIPATANTVTRWLQQATKLFAKQVPKLRRESMSKFPNAQARIDEQLSETVPLDDYRDKAQRLVHREIGVPDWENRLVKLWGLNRRTVRDIAKVAGPNFNAATVIDDVAAILRKHKDLGKGVDHVGAGAFGRGGRQEEQLSEAVASGGGVHVNFEKGDRLSLIMSREGMKNFGGPQRFEATALDDGATGGWDVYDVKPKNPRLFDDPDNVSVYGFDIDKINGVSAEDLDDTDYDED